MEISACPVGRLKWLMHTKHLSFCLTPNKEPKTKAGCSFTLLYWLIGVPAGAFQQLGLLSFLVTVHFCCCCRQDGGPGSAVRMRWAVAAGMQGFCCSSIRASFYLFIIISSETKVFHLLVSSLSACNGQGWATLEPGFTWVAGTPEFQPSPAPSQGTR